MNHRLFARSRILVVMMVLYTYHVAFAEETGFASMALREAHIFY